MLLTYFRWWRNWSNLVTAAIDFFRFDHIASISSWRRPRLIPLRCSRNTTANRRMRNVSSSWRHRSFTDWRATTRFSDTVDVHFLITRVFPPIWILFLCLQKFLVPIFIRRLLSCFFHDVVNFLSLTCWM